VLEQALACVPDPDESIRVGARFSSGGGRN
jgi:hypothetical protein